MYISEHLESYTQKVLEMEELRREKLCHTQSSNNVLIQLNNLRVLFVSIIFSIYVMKLNNSIRRQNTKIS